jgi:hypothetical protein
VIYQIGEEVGIPYDPSLDPLYYVRYVAHRDYYIYKKPWGWLDGFFSNASRLLRYSGNISLLTGYDVRNVAGMYATQRTRAYRRIWLDESENTLTPALTATFEKRSLFDDTRNRTSNALFMDSLIMEADRQAELQAVGDLNQLFGNLNPWDSFFFSSNGDANTAFHFWNIALLRGFEVHYTSRKIGEMFLKNLASVNTFITNAAWDLVIFPAAIPPSLACHTDLVASVENSNSLVQDSEIVVNYVAGAFADIPDLQQRSIFFPYYSKSCHAVSLTEPLKFYNDVKNWLNVKGLALGGEAKDEK